MPNLEQIYGNKKLPNIDSILLNEAHQLAKKENISDDDALLYILDMMIEKPFE